MTRMHVQYDLAPDQLLPALIGIATAESLTEPLLKALGGHDSHREPIREVWMNELVAQFRATGARVDDRMVANVHRVILGDVYGLAETRAIAKAIRPSSLMTWQPGRRKPARIYLTQNQIAELVALIRAHYRVEIRAGTLTDWTIDQNLIRRWKNLGVVAPDVSFDGMIGDSFVAGRLAQILEDGATVGDMRRMAREFPLSREASLTLQAVQDQVSFDLSGGAGYRAGQIAGRMIVGENNARVRDVIAAYRAGELRASPTNRRELSAEEIDALGGNRAVEGWRALGRELRNRMASTDRERDWERVAVSSLRQSANVGAIAAMAEQGAEELWYDVHENACDYCKRMYLNGDGSPKIFKVAAIMEEVMTNGGANYDRTVAEWRPTALLHPWCQCRPRRRIAGVTPAGRVTKN